ncbi:MAG TPA: 3-hydroxyacyl-CoA dehydrogenase NAD-binding domain-containing protein [Acidocella sp.]|jgi:carnitine 3-dehydrogenase|uniref:3-hydroxyacyl-CoA dehydrogenase NAD-binding domain-containing protein n=1 Tax=Acidocella sp. TaxID=50710 RepID=UPI002C50E7CE|nr:3-hydroxyacyl-CoA dehydrogenase NAD-binding domain-containing protein [Acidocella sp.]HVE21540.1 3-hydroxyacyl-CoA dehydrogenase NAD-binding domain-containing protein [Acidocella sp.]
MDTGSNKIEHIGIVGAGLIGAHWAAYFLAQGFAVSAFDPDPRAAARLAATVADIWPAMEQAGLVRIAGAPSAVAFAPLREVCGRVQFIMENGPESVAAKTALIAEIDAMTAPEVIIASSSSSLLPSDYQSQAAHPGRVLGAHPFNPPSLIPLVEIVPGRLTNAGSVERAMKFFAAIGKHPIHVRREQAGFVANRMTAALYREAVDLVASGVATVEDVDAAICQGPGLRWAFMGPHLLYHLGGGEGGYRHYLEHLGPSQEARWATLRTSPLTPALREQLIAGVEDELRALRMDEPARQRDQGLGALLRLRAAMGDKP